MSGHTLAMDDANATELNCLYSPTDNVVYCYVPRAACSTLRAVWMQIHAVDECNRHPALRRRGYHTVQRRWPKAKAEEVTQGYVIVRHPFSRAISSYELSRQSPELMFSRELTAPDITFRQFCHLLLEKSRTGELSTLNEHVRPVTKLLLPETLDKLSVIKLEDGPLIQNVVDWYTNGFGTDSDVAVRAQQACATASTHNVKERRAHGCCVVDEVYNHERPAPLRTEYTDPECMAAVEEAYRRDYATFSYAPGCEAFRALQNRSQGPAFVAT